MGFLLSTPCLAETAMQSYTDDVMRTLETLYAPSRLSLVSRGSTRAHTRASRCSCLRCGRLENMERTVTRLGRAVEEIKKVSALSRFSVRPLPLASRVNAEA